MTMRVPAILSALVLVAVSAMGCVDGTTPDCSAASSNCGPDLGDGAAADGPSEAASEGGPADGGEGGSAVDAPADAPKDGPVDAPKG